MSKFSVSYGESTIVFVNNKTNKPETLDMYDRVDLHEALRGSFKEFKDHHSNSAKAVSLITEVLSSPAMDGYRGQVPVNEALPKEAKAAMRRAEEAVLFPLFRDIMERKNWTEAQLNKEFDAYMTHSREGGTYANARSIALSYFCQLGKTPIAENGKLLTVAAMKKLIDNAKSDIAPEPKFGFSGKLVSLAAEINARKDNNGMGSLPEAIHALKDMLATFQGLEREAAEALTENLGSKGAAAVASAAVAQAKASSATQETENTALADKERTLWIKYNDAAIDLHEFTVAMHEIGITVNEDGDDVTVDSSYLSEDEQVALM